MRWVREVGTWHSQDPCTQLKLSSHKWQFSPRSEGSELHIWLCSLGALHWEDEPLELLALKASKAYIQVTQKAMGNRLHSYRVNTQISHVLGPRA